MPGKCSFQDKNEQYQQWLLKDVADVSIVLFVVKVLA